MTETSKPEFSTNDEYVLKALNIHGAFFERRCQEVVSNIQELQILETNYPVEHHGKASNLDIWAEYGINNPTRRLLLIECKKNNPEFVDWVFFPQSNPPYPHILIRKLNVPSYQATNWNVLQQFQLFKHDLIIANEARETKGDYMKIKHRNDWTKTSNHAITEAADQIALATQALLLQEQRVLTEFQHIYKKQNTSAYPPYIRLFFFPIIVTTAHLFTCQFQVLDVDLATGEIPLERGKLFPCPYLIYNYPVPTALQSVPHEMGLDYTRETLSHLARLPVFIVQSIYLPQFLLHLRDSNTYIDTFSDAHDSNYHLRLKPEDAMASR